MFRTRLISVCAAVVAVLGWSFAHGQDRFTEENAERALRHATVEWAALVPHLPDPVTGDPAKLIVAADVLRARRMPDDALDYYRYALVRGGNETDVMNRIGVTLLELHRNAEALAAFKRVIALNQRNAEGWNNLGATEYVQGNYRAAVRDYQHAVKLDAKAAVFRSNLGTAYFGLHDLDSARKQFAQAAQLDSHVFEKSGSTGLQAHILSSADRGSFCFEMAKLAAANHDEASMLRWLTQASESGFDLLYQMQSDRDLQIYRRDDRVLTIVRNAKMMRAGAVASAGPAPVLPPITQQN